MARAVARILTPFVLALLGLASATAADAAREPVTPIRHFVVIFGENISFDHYFGTYPHARNVGGEPKFTEREGTPAVDGLTRSCASPTPTSPTRRGSGRRRRLRATRITPTPPSSAPTTAA